MSAARPLARHTDEALRITDAANAAGAVMRVMGGVGIALRCPSAHEPPLRRAYADIDIVGRRRQREEITALLLELGYQQDEEFNRLHGAGRLYFWDPVNERQLDVFLDQMQMCHTIELADRLQIHDRTLPLADLLLTKLQVVEANRKDLLDVVVLLGDHELTGDERGINLGYLTLLTSGDWGLWRTTAMIAERADRFAAELDALESRERVHERAQELLRAMACSEKTRRWRMRARVGERKRWYELPEEAR